MNLHWIDWTIVVAVLLVMLGGAVYCQRYMRSVADFLAANRLAGRYLLTVSVGSTGAVGMVALWQMIYNAGLATQWWALMSIPLALFIALTGFVTYRFRETRALTMAQFMEMRYSRRFRFFSGLLCWISGILNYGVFPAVAGRLFIAMLGLPEHVHVAGRDIGVFPLVMAGYLLIAVYIACSGGQIALIVSDFLQESFCKIVLIATIMYLLLEYSWPEIAASLINTPPGESMIDPLDTAKVKGFNVWYFLIGLYGSIYSFKAWQGNSGYNSAAKTPHEAQMAGILGSWRDLLKTICCILPPVAAFMVLSSPAFAETAAPIQESLAAIGDPQVRNQMTTPMFMAHILPVGLLGMMVAMFVTGVISVDDTYIHAWGTIFIQDVVMPIRKKPFTPKTHMLLLRLSVIGVAFFGFVFSLFFPFQDAILMFFALSGAIYLGGAGITIIGGLYWKRGTTAGAFAAMTVGTALAFGGMLLEQLWVRADVVGKLLRLFPDNGFLLANTVKFPLSGQVIYFIAMVSATLAYVLVSLLGPRRVFDLDKMLCRDASGEKPKESAKRDWRKALPEKLGISAHFTRFDKIVYFVTLGWSMGWWAIFLIGTVTGLTFGLPKAFWSWFWYFKIWLSVVLGIVCTVWMTTGGFRDLFQLLRDLHGTRKDDSDDGFVSREK